MRLLAIMIILIIGLSIVGCVQEEKVIEMEPDELEPIDEPIVGGDKDEHGCIGSAGYTWCESKQKCLRSWEEDCVSEEEVEKMTTDECVDIGGTVIDVSSGAGCSDNEVRIADVTDSDIPNICCVLAE